MKPEDIIRELMRMVGTVEFFPADEGIISNIAFELQRFVESPDLLTLAIQDTIQDVGRWSGVANFKSAYQSRECAANKLLSPPEEYWEPPKQIAETADPEKEAEIQAYNAKLERNIKIAAARKQIRDIQPAKVIPLPKYLQ